MTDGLNWEWNPRKWRLGARTTAGYGADLRTWHLGPLFLGKWVTYQIICGYCNQPIRNPLTFRAKGAQED